jgi:aspartate-semialdehyde dehydrogenase
MKVEDAAKLDATHLDIVFSAVESEVAEELEPKFAKTTPVISTARAFRYDEDVPILIPGVNSEQAEIINIQKKKRGWKGFISPQPNCTSTGLAITLKPIYDSFGIDSVIMTSLQAVSGAGRSPGVIALDILNNVIPYIPREEEAVQSEILKILGKYDNGRINPANIKLSCTCTRVDVTDGHTESVFVDTTKSCTVDDVKKAFANFGKGLIDLKLPSAPVNMIVVNDDPFRPQPRLDRNTQDGMATTVGRIRKDNVFVKGIKYVLVSHNTKMGAAKGAVLVAEYLNKKGYI